MQWTWEGHILFAIPSCNYLCVKWNAKKNGAYKSHCVHTSKLSLVCMFKEYIHIWTLSVPELVPCSLLLTLITTCFYWSTYRRWCDGMRDFHSRGAVLIRDPQLWIPPAHPCQKLVILRTVNQFSISSTFLAPFRKQCCWHIWITCLW